MNPFKKVQRFFRREWRKRWVSRKVFDAVTDNNSAIMEAALQVTSTTRDLGSECTRLEKRIEQLEKERQDLIAAQHELFQAKIRLLELEMALIQAQRFRFNEFLN